VYSFILRPKTCFVAGEPPKKGIKMLKTITIAIMFTALSAISAHADSAFGIEYGGELPSGAVDVDDGYFRVSTPPKPHSSFETYAVKYHTETGVCFITALSKTFENDKYGTQAKTEYDKLVAALDRKYGPEGDRWEELKAEALWDDADEFAMSLLEGDRNHARWFLPSADSKNEFNYVQIEINAIDSSKTYIKLDYNNRILNEDCTAKISEADNDSL